MDKCANNEENRGLAYNRVVFTVEVPVDLEVSLWQDPNVSRPREHLIVGAVEALREYVLHKQRTDKPYAGVEEDVVEVKDLTLDNGVKVSWEAKSDVGMIGSDPERIPLSTHDFFNDMKKRDPVLWQRWMDGDPSLFDGESVEEIEKRIKKEIKEHGKAVSGVFEEADQVEKNRKGWTFTARGGTKKLVTINIDEPGEALTGEVWGRLINSMIKMRGDFDKGGISDGYHTFDELYECRHVLWVKLCYLKDALDVDVSRVIRSRKHSDGSGYEGWFLLMMVYPDGRQLSFHLPYKYWDKCNFATTLGRAPEFDGHTTADVIERLGEL